jgi:hypothetical protein
MRAQSTKTPTYTKSDPTVARSISQLKGGLLGPDGEQSGGEDVPKLIIVASARAHSAPHTFIAPKKKKGKTTVFC